MGCTIFGGRELAKFGVGAPQWGIFLISVATSSSTKFQKDGNILKIIEIIIDINFNHKQSRICVAICGNIDEHSNQQLSYRILRDVVQVRGLPQHLSI